MPKRQKNDLIKDLRFLYILYQSCSIFEKNYCLIQINVKSDKTKTNSVEIITFNDTHREKAPSNKIPTVTRSMNMDIWVVGKPNQLFIRGS